MKLSSLIPNSFINESVSDLYSIFQDRSEQNKQTHPGNI